jgi:hypothetical protein
MILRRTQEPKSLFRNFEITRTDFNGPVILRLPTSAIVVMIALITGILAITWLLLPIPWVRLAVTRVLLAITTAASSTSLILLWPIILSAILVRAVMSAVLMMSCTHGRY